ncbi:MAG: hypothetical protein GY863_24095 [bacterium]|nr:hypothetical protein [bacterium]
MKRREFMCSAGCGLAGIVLPASAVAAGDDEKQQRRSYEWEIEIYEAREDTWCHKKGDKFKYPDELGKVCPWLRDSMSGFIRALENGATLGWRYEGTPYEKQIDPNGITTEFVRCPDPTANLVAKITKRAVTG